MVSRFPKTVPGLLTRKALGIDEIKLEVVSKVTFAKCYQ